MDNQIHISELIPDSDNPRRRTERSFSTIYRSLQKVGAARSIVIDEQNRIRAGNGTIEAASQLGIEKVRVIEADGNEIIAVKRKGLSEDDWKWYSVADNQSGLLSEWDAENIEFISEEVDISDLFSQSELEAILTTLEEESAEVEPLDFDGEDAVSAKQPRGQKEVWCVCPKCHHEFVKLV